MPKLYSTVGRVIAVTSCKGGVGKSTVSARLAFRLAARGHRVGLFDADVHGPSLPTQLPELNGSKIALGDRGWSVEPLIHEGVKLMSFGWFSASWGVKDGEVRTLAAAPLAFQLLHTTEWADLDYLIIDSPPGTGDIPRALYTRIPLAGALVVTTPSRLATVDVVRGVKMLLRLGVPILSVVENMSSFTCDAGKVYHPFGRGHLEEVLASACGGGGGGAAAAAVTGPTAADNDVPSFRLPIVAADGDTGVMALSSSQEAEMAKHFDEIAAAVEAATADANAVELPHQLPSHELPHWPTIMATNELFR